MVGSNELLDDPTSAEKKVMPMPLLVILCRRVASMIVGHEDRLVQRCVEKAEEQKPPTALPCSCLMSSPDAYNAIYAISVLYPHLMHAPFGEAISDCCRNNM